MEVSHSNSRSGRESPEGAAGNMETSVQTAASVGAAAGVSGSSTTQKIAATPSDTANQASGDPGEAVSQVADVGPTDGSGISTSEASETVNDITVSIDKDVVDLLDKDGLTTEERNTLFGRAVRIDQDGQKNDALKCYLKCLMGLKEDSRFSLLPQCLRNIGDIFYGKEEFEKAISFIQAEKLYYENVLIDDTQLQKQIDEAKQDGSGEGENSLEALRATEYEHLAKLCLDEKQIQLALEYAGKSTKLRKEVLGDDHPRVKESLDFFTSVYAEAGKHQYSESLTKYETAEPVDPLSEDQGSLDDSGEPVSILRRRKNTEGEKVEEKHVRFDESNQAADEDMSRSDQQWAWLVLLMLLVVCVCILCVISLYICCIIFPSDWCQDFKPYVHYAVMRVRYWYYHYTSNSDSVKYT